MPLGVFTYEFNHLQYIPVIKRMYETGSIDEIKAYAGFSQIERFQHELETLQRFGLHKELDIRLPAGQKHESGLKSTDGKAEVIISASNAKVKETYRDERNRKCYQRTIHNAFVESFAYRTDKVLIGGQSGEQTASPRCLNCGARLDAEGENYFCPYCRTRYQAEAYHYLLTRFFIEGALRNMRYVFLVLLIPLAIAISQVKGLITQAQVNSISTFFGVVFSIVIILAMLRSFGAYFRHSTVIQKIRQHDPRFSVEIFTMRLIDLLTGQPETALAAWGVLHSAGNGSDHGSGGAGECPIGVIFKNVQHLTFRTYRHDGDLEIVECVGKVDALFLSRAGKRVHIEEKRKKMSVCLARRYGTVTPLHYMPDQFTCANCGAHQVVEQAGDQICRFCHTRIPMVNLDWVLCTQEKRVI